VKTHRFSACHLMANQGRGAPCQAIIATKDGTRRQCRLPAMSGGRFCASHQDVPCATAGRLWWCFRVHGWRMFSPSFAPRVKKLTRDLPPTLGRADRDVLRLLSCLRQWSGDRRNVQAGIKQIIRLTRIPLWQGQLHLFGRRRSVPLAPRGAYSQTTVGGTYRAGCPLSKVSVSPNPHDFGSTPSPGLLPRNSGQALQGKAFKGGAGG